MKPVPGLLSRTTILDDVQPSDSIENVKAMIVAKMRSEAKVKTGKDRGEDAFARIFKDMRLVLAAGLKQLEDGRILSDYNMGQEPTLWVLGRIRGGGAKPPENLDRLLAAVGINDRQFSIENKSKHEVSVLYGPSCTSQTVEAVKAGGVFEVKFAQVCWPPRPGALPLRCLADSTTYCSPRRRPVRRTARDCREASLQPDRTQTSRE